jgi:hypothetical protein
VAGFGGHVLKRLGDGLMALFGYPQAQENDAERGVRAALAIQRALAEITARNRDKAAPELSARIGLESGPAVIEATGEVFGDAPNVAARVQAAAEPGSVFVTMNVQRQMAGLFVAEEQGAQELKGLPEPIHLFRIVRASGGGRRGGTRALTQFVGREEELGLLARRRERAKGGEGQLLLIVGEPGLGKSRLIEELWSASQLLAEADLLFVEGARPQASYRFKHALIQDAAYESLLKSRRQTLHRRAGEGSRSLRRSLACGRTRGFPCGRCERQGRKRRSNGTGGAMNEDGFRRRRYEPPPGDPPPRKNHRQKRLAPARVESPDQASGDCN